MPPQLKTIILFEAILWIILADTCLNPGRDNA